ncbi:MFS transporter [Microbacterium sp. Root166]|nr:MFS transporter [Microbacterium sp. Root166]
MSRGTIARYAVGSIGTGGFATLPGLVLTYYLTDSLGVAALAAGVVITLAKVWDVLVDPVIGALTDRDLARRGTRRRLMLVGALSIPVLFALTFAVPAALGPVIAAIWVFLAFTLTATAFSLFQVPYIALPAELTGDYDERTRLLTWRVVVLTLAILLFGAGGPALRRLADDSTTGYLVMGIVAGLVIGLGMLIATTVARRAAAGVSRVPAIPTTPASDAARTSIREHFADGIRALRRSRPFRLLLATFVLQSLATGLMLAGAQYVATWVLESEAAVELLFVALIAPALFAAPAWGVFARRVGKERSFALASTIFAVAALSIVGTLWAPGAWIYLPVGIAGIAYAGMQSLPMAMLPDVISHDERASGPGRAGSFSGVWTAGETVGFALGATVLSIILTVTGYVSSTAGQTVEQPDAAITGIVVSFSVAPAALIVLSLVTLARYPLRRRDIQSQPA